MPIPHWVTGVNRRFANRAMLVVAPHVPPFAVLHHHGRRTGREYRTPVLAFRSPHGVVVPLFYGLEVQWLRNVLLAGSANLVRRGWRYRLGQVDVRSGDAALGLLPVWIRPVLRVLRVDHALEGQIVRAVPAARRSDDGPARGGPDA